MIHNAHGIEQAGRDTPVDKHIPHPMHPIASACCDCIRPYKSKAGIAIWVALRIMFCGEDKVIVGNSGSELYTRVSDKDICLIPVFKF